MVRKYDYDILKRLWDKDNALSGDLSRWASLYNKEDLPYRRDRWGGMSRNELDANKLRSLLKNQWRTIGVPNPGAGPSPETREHNHELIKQIFLEDPTRPHAEAAREYFQRSGRMISDKWLGILVRNNREEWLKDAALRDALAEPDPTADDEGEDIRSLLEWLCSEEEEGEEGQA